MCETWLVFDDVPTGHHPGYLDRVVDALQRAGVRPITAAPSPPCSLIRPEDWIEIQTRSLRSVAHNRKQWRQVVDHALLKGAGTVLDLFLDKNIWAADLLTEFEARVHILHHAEQYRRESRRGWAGFRTRLARGQLRRIETQGAAVIVHTKRAAEIVGTAISTRAVVNSGYPVPEFPPPRRRDPRQDPVFLFTGAGRPEKGLDVLIDAFRQIDDPPSLRIVGGQPSGVRASSPTQDLPSITWIDRKLTDEELWAEYTNASVAVLPYRATFGEHGGPSSVLLETLALGLPIVTTPALAPQLPAHFEGSIVARDHSAPALAEAITRARASIGELIQHAHEEGPAFARSHHGYDTYITAIRQAAAHSRSRSSSMPMPRQA